jgi:hypothetical protein
MKNTGNIDHGPKSIILLPQAFLNDVSGSNDDQAVEKASNLFPNE